MVDIGRSVNPSVDIGQVTLVIPLPKLNLVTLYVTVKSYK